MAVVYTNAVKIARMNAVTTAAGTVRVAGAMAANEEGGDTAQFLGTEEQPAPPTLGGFVIVDTAPRLWWKRKPKALPEEEAEQQVRRVAGVIERIAREQVASPEPVSVQREQARQAVAPLVRDMPGFDWSAMYRAAIAALIQQRLEEQARLIAAQEMERIRLFEADEDDVLILLMAA